MVAEYGPPDGDVTGGVVVGGCGMGIVAFIQPAIKKREVAERKRKERIGRSWKDMIKVFLGYDRLILNDMERKLLRASFSYCKT